MNLDLETILSEISAADLQAAEEASKAFKGDGDDTSPPLRMIAFEE